MHQQLIDLKEQLISDETANKFEGDYLRSLEQARDYDGPIQEVRDNDDKYIPPKDSGDDTGGPKLFDFYKINE